jgi:hypothetical protein
LDQRHIGGHEPTLGDSRCRVAANWIEADYAKIARPKRFFDGLRLGTCSEHDDAARQHRRKARMCCIDPQRDYRAKRKKCRGLKKLVVRTLIGKLVEYCVCNRCGEKERDQG